MITPCNVLIDCPPAWQPWATALTAFLAEYGYVVFVKPVDEVGEAAYKVTGGTEDQRNNAGIMCSIAMDMHDYKLKQDERNKLSATGISRRVFRNT